MKEKLVIALGGNALIKKGQLGTIQEQLENLKIPAKQIVEIFSEGKYSIVITHGNGPQVGNLLLMQEKCESKKIPKMPLEILVAMTQGQIGYMIEVSLDNEFMNLGIENPLIATMLTYVQVDENDPAFKRPTKPIGPTFSEKKPGFVKTEKGYRKVVPSPLPLKIVEKNEILAMLNSGIIVIACGGGGIPVTKEHRKFEGIEAVIDKDLASAKLAQDINADILLIATDVKYACINYGKENQKELKKISLEEAKRYLQEGHFSEGSMKPKIQAAINFLEGNGKRAIICHLNEIKKALKGEAGTQILRK
ncbi:MAG: carbamate kinase [Candidatus Altiarchaeota archaeon]